MNINFSNISADLMETEAANDGYSVSDNRNSSVGTPREGKRKKENSVAFSGTMVLQISLEMSKIYITHHSYQDKRKRGNIKRSSPLPSTSRK